MRISDWSSDVCSSDLLNGVHRPDKGKIEVGGAPLSTHSPEASRSAGIAMNYQEMSLVPTLTVAQNIFLTRDYRAGTGLIEIGKASVGAVSVSKCRSRWSQYTLKNNQNNAT